jgi:glycosyltransferase involved in cell wall biosynthesis
MLTVAICTYNRSALLPKALESVASQTLAEDFEILIVDNGSTDNTREIVASWQRRDARIRYVIERTPGISHARNCAIREARGEYLAFLDDDAWADAGWLENLIAPIRSIQPAPKCVVGPVSLVWDGKRPDWFPPRFESLLCSYRMGETSRFLKPGEYLLTTNSLFHRATLLKIGGMRTDLGHKRNVLIGGEDNDIFNRLLANGHCVYYAASANVFHPVPKERQTRRFLLRRLFWDGAAQPLFDHSPLENGTRSRPSSEFLTDAKRSARFALDILRGTIKGDRSSAEDGLYRLVQRAGRMRTHFMMTLNPR